jgi:ABC-type xylose transport system substrate-binding protein
MLAFYAFSTNAAGDSNKAKELLQKAKDLGVSKVSLERVIRDPDKTIDFISKLSGIGGIE